MRLLVLLMLVSCGPTYHTHTPRQKTIKAKPCTVKVLKNKDAFIACPDGSYATVKAKVKKVKDNNDRIIFKPSIIINEGKKCKK